MACGEELFTYQLPFATVVYPDKLILVRATTISYTANLNDIQQLVKNGLTELEIKFNMLRNSNSQFLQKNTSIMRSMFI